MSVSKNLFIWNFARESVCPWSCSNGSMVYPHTKCGIPTSNNNENMLLTIFLELRPEVKGTVTRKKYAAIWDPNVYPHLEFGIPTS